MAQDFRSLLPAMREQVRGERRFGRKDHKGVKSLSKVSKESTKAKAKAIGGFRNRKRGS